MSRLNFIHPSEFKKRTAHKKIERAPLPKRVTLSLSQHTGAPSEPCVKVGDAVKTGTLIAQSKGFISTGLHSSISGKVIAIEDSAHPIIGTFRAISIESDGQDQKAFSDSHRDVSGISRQESLDIVKDAGIVGLGGAAFPTHVKLSPPQDKKIDTLIINGAECEPFLTCDHALMLERPKEIIHGIYLIAKVLGVKDVIIGVEENKLDAIEDMGSALFRVRDEACRVKVVKLKTRYPQGGEKQLVSTLLNREVPSGGLPLDIGCVVQNVQTVFAIYEAAHFGKPLYERVVTVSGSFLKSPNNVLVRIGTPIKDLLEFCGVDFKRGIYKIIMGGPMTGVSQYNLDAPVIKGTSGILVLDKRFRQKEEIDCIRCSRCIEACPAGLMPCMIGIGVKNNRFDIASSYDPLDCIECGSCGYVCPSNIPLVQYIKLAKTKK
ncbi:MAG: electron transport complex subunit RsxC [Candidatus Omnitrophica bacterium]|nr:electron transport complex subunit RsxC [Candidatus Omnitrophota bacterium]